MMGAVDDDPRSTDMAREITTVVEDLHYLECPRWHQDRIWFVDFYSQ